VDFKSCESVIPYGKVLCMHSLLCPPLTGTLHGLGDQRTKLELWNMYSTFHYAHKFWWT